MNMIFFLLFSLWCVWLFSGAGARRQMRMRVPCRRALSSCGNKFQGPLRCVWGAYAIMFIEFSPHYGPPYVKGGPPLRKVLTKISPEQT